jgi:hypothetical protein
MSPRIWIPTPASGPTTSPVSPTSGSTDDEDDDEEINCKVMPDWSMYRNILQSRGFRLDTVRDVKNYYERSCHRVCDSTMRHFLSIAPDDALCPDAGLVRWLFSQFRSFITRLHSVTIFFGVPLLMAVRLL